MCQQMIDAIPSSIYLIPEFIKFIEYWRDRFREVHTKTGRKNVFKEFIRELAVK